jgi:hypothetical protein
MTENPFAPPTAQVGTTSVTTPAFFVVSQRKLWVMAIITAGLYVVYWIYRNWKLYKTCVDPTIMPIVRTVFGVFFIASLFTKIQRRLQAFGIAHPWHPRALATLFILATCMAVFRVWVPNAYAALGLLIIAIVVQTFSLARAQGAINVLENDLQGQANSRFTAANWVWILVGACFWLLAGFEFYLLGTDGFGPAAGS